MCIKPKSTHHCVLSLYMYIAKDTFFAMHAWSWVILSGLQKVWIQNGRMMHMISMQSFDEVQNNILSAQRIACKVNYNLCRKLVPLFDMVEGEIAFGDLRNVKSH